MNNFDRITTQWKLILFRNIREKDISKYHIQLCLALLCMYVLTLILVIFSAESVTTIYGGCVSLSLLVHYFTLVAVMWMGAEALLMFQKLVIVFVRITTKFIVIISIICWCKSTFGIDDIKWVENKSTPTIKCSKIHHGALCSLYLITAIITAIMALKHRCKQNL